MTRIQAAIVRHKVKIRVALVALIVIAIFILGWKGGIDYVTNLYTELIGVAISIGFTVVFVDTFYERRSRERETQAMKARLVREAGSRSNDIAISAVDTLREREWLTGENGLLRGERFWMANLRNADLHRANLQDAFMEMADLRGADLHEAILKGADLNGADLRDAFVSDTDLSGASMNGARIEAVDWPAAYMPDVDLSAAYASNANLQGATLERADLQGAILDKAWLQGASFQEALMSGTTLEEANLSKANLCGTDLSYANLYGANLQGAYISAATNLAGATMPDGKSYAENKNIERFTNEKDPGYQKALQKINEIRINSGYYVL